MNYFITLLFDLSLQSLIEAGWFKKSGKGFLLSVTLPAPLWLKDFSSLSIHQGVWSNSLSNEILYGLKSASFGEMPTCFCGFLCWTSINNSRINGRNFFCHRPRHNCSLYLTPFHSQMSMIQDELMTKNHLNLRFGGVDGEGRFYSTLLR